TRLSLPASRHVARRVARQELCQVLANRAAADLVPVCCPGAADPVPACCPGAARAWAAVARDDRHCPEDSACQARVDPRAAVVAAADSAALADSAAVAASAGVEVADDAAAAAGASSSFLAHTKAGLDSSGPSNRRC